MISDHPGASNTADSLQSRTDLSFTDPDFRILKEHVLIRRFIAALILLSVAGTAAACGQSHSSTSSSLPSSAPPSASPSPSIDVSANTRQLCDQAGKVVTEDTAKALGTQVGIMLAARQAHNSGAEAAAKAKVKAQTDDWAKQLRDLAKTAADPAMATALNQTADGLSKLGSDEYLASITSTADASRLGKDITDSAAGLAKICG